MKRMLLLTASMLVLASSAMADMTNVRIAAHRKDKFVASKTVPSLCDNLATPTEEPNYSPNFDNIPCSQYTVTGPAPGASTIYVVVGQAGTEGIAAASFGVDYDGRNPDHVLASGDETGINPDLSTFTACADGLSFPNDGGMGDFPKPKGGIRLTWNVPGSCANEVIPPDGVHAVVGSIYVYAYSSDLLRLTPNNNLQSGPEIAVADCAGVQTVLTEILPQSLWDDIMGRVQLGSGSGGYTPCGIVATKASTWGKIKTQYHN